MAYQVALLNFEGPLDLLLQLIERAQIEVTDISLASITGQYLDYIQQLQNLEAGELDWFVELATRLLLLKSQALLPDPGPEHQEALAELTEQLSQYHQYRQAAATLAQLLAADQYRYERPVAPPTLAADKLPPVALEAAELRQLFAAALQRLPAPRQTLVTRPELTIAEASSRLVERARRQQFKVTELLASCHYGSEVVAFFLALLELIKQRVLAVTQTSQFADITISYVG